MAWYVRRLLITTLYLMVMFEEVSAKARRRKKGGRRKTRYSQFYYLMVAFFLAILGPIIFTFATSLWKDPVVPRLVRAAVQSLKDAVFSHMGRPAGATAWTTTARPGTEPPRSKLA